MTFVAGAAVGDRLTLEITSAKRSFARGRILEVLEAGPGRREAPCEHAGTCGGCQWLHVDYSSQIEAKSAILGSQLRTFVGEDLVIHPMIDIADQELGWRRRARFAWVRPRRSDRALVGFFEAGSKRVTPIDGCVQMAPMLRRAHEAIVERLAPRLTGKGSIVVLAGEEGVTVAIEGPCEPAAAEALAQHEAIAGVRLGKRSFGLGEVTLEGGLRVAPDQFAQASAIGNQKLRQVVAAMVAQHAKAGSLRIAEFFSGAGNLTEAFVEHAEAVVAVDTMATTIPLDRVRFIQGSAIDMARSLARKEEPFDVVVLDPPRIGAKELMPWLAKLNASEIIYVSCDPATLVRDMTELASKYALVEVQAIDMMPQTSHFEVVARLRRRDPA